MTDNNRDSLQSLDDDGESHRVVHSDIISDVEDVVLLAKAHRRLLHITIFAGLIMLLVSVGFFMGLHEPAAAPIASTNTKSAAQYGRGVYVAVNTDEGSGISSYLNNPQQQTQLISTDFLDQQRPNRNSSLQVSQDAQTIAYSTASGDSRTIAVKRGDAELIEIAQFAAANLYDWLLSQNGDYIYTLTGSTDNLQLVRYSTSDKKSKILVENFTPITTNELTGLVYSTEGSLQLYGVSGDNTIYGSHYNILNDEFSSQAILKPKISAPLRLADQPVSPDGTFLLLEYDQDNQEHYELVFLNSRTSNTVFSAGKLSTQAWLPDSLKISFVNQDNTLMWLEVGPRTPKELKQAQGTESAAFVRWLDGEQFIMRSNDGTISLRDVNGGVTDLFDGQAIQALAIGKIKLEN